MKDIKKYYIIIIAEYVPREVVLNIREYLSDKFKNKKCAVLGFARSNKPLVEILLAAGATVTVRDKNTAIESDADYIRFSEMGANFVLGESYLCGLSGDYIFRSPAFRPDLPEIKSAVENGAILSSEMELFFEVCPAKIIGITGSDGKTTTTTLTHLLLDTECKAKGIGRAYVGGNIGAPLLPLVFDMTKDDFAIVELSSFQLHTMTRSPSVAAITNLSPNHLDWHTGMGEYIDAKLNICRHAPIERLVTNAENAITREIAEQSELALTLFSSKANCIDDVVPNGKENCRAIYENNGVIYIDNGEKREEIIATSDILLPGRHNVENYMTAIALTEELVSLETVKKVATTFRGVAHRLELVREKDGVRFYNSSIDSSPSRTAAALGALPKAPIVICGGYDKKIPFDTLAKSLCEKAKAVVLTGDTAEKIFAEIKACPEYDSSKLPVKHIPDFREATLAAAEMAKDGDIVLLSPACASFDHFKDFAARGEYFKEIVNGL